VTRGFNERLKGTIDVPGCLRVHHKKSARGFGLWRFPLLGISSSGIANYTY
jgi:hypothetical protein